MYFEKATKIFKDVKSTVKILSIIVAFLENMNFNTDLCLSYLDLSYGFRDTKIA